MGGFAPKGRAKVDPRHPQAFAICERCGFMYNHRDLQFQPEWHGTKILPIRWLVCPTCLDQPNMTLRAVKLPADPVPVLNPRPETTHKHQRRWPGEPFPQPYEGEDIPEE